VVERERNAGREQPCSLNTPLARAFCFACGTPNGIRTRVATLGVRPVRAGVS